MNRYAIIDFETTGFSVGGGDRAIEIGAVIIEGKTIVHEYESLINPGVLVPRETTLLTGITQEMVDSSPGPETVFREVNDIIEGATLVAHMASFDRAFWTRERALLGQGDSPNFLCTMLLARRVYPWAKNHKLATLAQIHQFSASGFHHRALHDATIAAHLFLTILSDLSEIYCGHTIDPQFLAWYQKLEKTRARSKLPPRTGPIHPQDQTPLFTRDLSVPKRAVYTRAPLISEPQISDAPPQTIPSDNQTGVTFIDRASLPTPTKQHDPHPKDEQPAARMSATWFWWVVAIFGVLVLLK